MTAADLEGATELALERAAAVLGASRRVLVFTGAGLSTGSGIPDFRGPNGVWKRRQPVYFQDFLASEDARIEHWDFKLESWDQFQLARPNAAHTAIVELERMGIVELLVTQNIDGLHQDAGSDPARVVEIHGTNRWIVCLSCGERSQPGPWMEEFRRSRRSPRCGCGGPVKSATISFGQAMPEAEMERAFDAAARADAALAIGSTLEVQPAALVPLAARRAGAPYVIVNRGDTAHDGVASVRLEGDCVELLPALVERVRARRG
ncbi:MAG: Sir2 family NAD-dependent protein deacetylase [Deltaproteobacteria bacterium]|nr:Sir2 family NAD-dependent protein deacetylase [Deltaproteobacteria bacterium]